MKKKVGITLQALMRSTRLKKKPILKLCDREMIAHQIDRLKTAKIPEIIILCTSDSEEDKILLDIAKREGIEGFAGPKEDVLLRLYQAAKKYELDYIIAPAGDNPLTDAEHIDILANYMIENDMDYADGVYVLPIGLFAKGIKFEALKKACEIKNENDTEGWMRYFVGTNNLFKTGKHKAAEWVFDDDFRLTVDTPNDFKLMEKIFEKFYKKGEVFSLEPVLKFLRNNPDIKNINGEIEQLGPQHFPFSVKQEYKKFVK